MTEIIAVASVKGSGCTTMSALGLAAALGVDANVVLVEADPSGGSLLGRCPTLDASVGGLYEAVFDRARNGIAGVAQQLGDVGVVVAQGDPYRITAAIERPRGWRSLLEGSGDVVIVDLGRLFPDSPASAIAGVADRVVLTSPAEPGPLAATAEWIGRGGQHGAASARVDSGRVSLLTVDAGSDRQQRVDVGHLDAELGVDHLGHLPFDPATIELLCRGSSLAHRSMRRSRLAPALRSVAARLYGGSLAEVRR